FETLQIIDCNEEALLKYGYTKKEFLQLSIKDIRPEEDIAKIKQAVQTEEAYGKIHKKIWRHKKKNGEIMYMDVTGHLIDYNGKRVSIVMLIDVTEKLRQEEQSEREKGEREAAIEILKDKDAKLENAQAIAKLGYWQLDVKSNSLYWSKEIYNIWGVAENVQPDVDFFVSTIHPNDVEHFLAAQKNVLLNNIELNEEHRIIAADGSIKWIHEKARLVKDEHGEVVFLTGTAQDITQRKNAEEELEKSNRHLKNAQRIVHMGNWEYDAVTDKLFWSDEMYNIFRKEQKEGEQLNLSDLIKQIHPDDLKHFETAKKNAEKNAVPMNFEHRIMMLDGTEKTVCEQGEISYNEELKRFLLIGTMQDITERKKAERKIYESNQRYEHVTKATYDAIWEWDLTSNKIYRAEGFETSFGFNLNEINKPETVWENFIHADDRQNVNKSIVDAINSKEEYWSHEYRLIKPNGEQAYVEDRAYILRNDQGKAKRIIGALRDITERKYYHDLEILEREILETNARGENTIEEVVEKYIVGIQKLHPGMIGSMQKLENNRLYNISSPNLPEPYLKAISGIEIGDNVGSCGTAAFLKENIIVSDIEHDVRWSRYKDFAEAAGLKACWSHPVFNSKNIVVATFAIYYNVTKIPALLEENTIKRGVNILQTILESYHRETALQESNKRYENVTTATSDAIWDY
ncbi:MAG: PAS domain-containing protein, partial [Ferruginibacter sp.]|nr:PAS domain-containing protein [Ferruginibacter sp.]